MNPDEIKKRLEPEEWELYLNACYCIKNNLAETPKAKMTKVTLERLATCRERSGQRRALLVKHQYLSLAKERICIGCGRYETKGCNPNCLWAKAIEGE